MGQLGYIVEYPVTLEADQWAITFSMTGHDSLRSVYETPDDGFILAGSLGQDVWIVKVDANANVIWQKKYGTPANDELGTFLSTSDGGYIVGGQTWGGPAGSVDWWIFKLNPDLSVAWQKTYGGSSTDWGGHLRETMEGGYIATGATHSFGVGNQDAWVLMLDAVGNIIWEKTYGGSSSDSGNAIYPTTDGGCIVLGQTESFGAGNSDIWVLKLNSDGSVAWQNTYGGSGYEHCHDIQQTADGGYVLAAGTESFGSGNMDHMVLKLDSNGNIEWQKAYGGPNHEGGEHHILQTIEGGYISITDTQSFGLGYWDILLLKLNADGSVAWQKTYGESDQDSAFAIQQTSNDSFIVGGGTYNFDSIAQDWLALKIDENGEIPGCDYISDVNVTVTNTNAIVQDTNVVPQDSSAIITNTDVVPQDTDVEQDTICYFQSTNQLPVGTLSVVNPSQNTQTTFAFTPPQPGRLTFIMSNPDGSKDGVFQIRIPNEGAKFNYENISTYKRTGSFAATGTEGLTESSFNVNIGVEPLSIFVEYVTEWDVCETDPLTIGEDFTGPDSLIIFFDPEPIETTGAQFLGTFNPEPQEDT